MEGFHRSAQFEIGTTIFDVLISAVRLLNTTDCSN